jgi:hypothetical protein
MAFFAGVHFILQTITPPPAFVFGERRLAPLPPHAPAVMSWACVCATLQQLKPSPSVRRDAAADVTVPVTPCVAARQR